MPGPRDETPVEIEMKTALAAAATILIVAMSSLASPLKEQPHTQAGLIGREDKDQVSLTFTIQFQRQTRIYYPERWELSPAAGTWFVVEFVSDTGDRYSLTPGGAVPMWPHEDGVREFRAGDELTARIGLGEGSIYGLRTQSGSLLDDLPPGKYKVKASYRVPDSGPVRRLILTRFAAEAEPIGLIVEDGYDP